MMKTQSKGVGGILISTIVLATAINTVPTITAVTFVGISEYWMFPVIALIILLSMKEVLLGSTMWTESLDSSLKMSIAPLIVSFVATVIFKISEVI